MASEKPGQEKTRKPTIKKPAATKATAKAPAGASPAASLAAGKLAIILVRGLIHARKDIIATIDNFMLRQKLACVVVPDTPLNRASVMKCKDYVTFGTITDETYNLLVEKRGEKDCSGKLKKFFRLHPPRGGFEKKGIKKPFNLGGALGHRGEKMNDLIQKML
ncbi:uL30 family ribosomal protein [Candidatus Woesearchaeota archaeon]|nr:uL30 family ribosomal protein [Candidatus Woesearchaeota archaeon]